MPPSSMAVNSSSSSPRAKPAAATDPQQQQFAATAAADSGGGLSRPHGLGGRKSLENGRPGLNHPGLDAAAQQPAAPTAPASAGADAGQQQQHPNQQQQQQQPQQGSAGSPEPDQTGPRPPQTLNCHVGDTKGLDAYLRSVPGSPSAPGGGTAAAASAAAGSAAAAGAIAATAAGRQPQIASDARHSSSSRAHAAAAGSAPAAHASRDSNNHRVHEASRTPLDEELGSCPPYAAKAVWGLRYTMEDKWAAVPNLMQLPAGLTAPLKRPAKKATGCGCMLPSKVLAKVSPSGRTSSGGKEKESKDGGKENSSSSSSSWAERNLSKASPTDPRQRLLTHHGSDDAAAAAAAGTPAGPGDSAAGSGGGGGAAAVSAGGGGALGSICGSGSSGLDSLHYFGVFDGHGGADAARHCAQRMHQVVCETVLSLLSEAVPEAAAATIVSALAGDTSSSGVQGVVGPFELADPAAPAAQQPSPAAVATEAAAPAAAAPAAAAPAAAAPAPAAAAPAPAAPASGADAAAASGTAAEMHISRSASQTAAAAAGAAAAAVSIAAPPDIAGSGGAWLLPALSRAFVALDHEFGALSEGSYVGTTAVVVLLSTTRLWVAHCGDSRAVLGRSTGLQVLTSDHKASRGDEVARVQAAGGHVWWDRVMGELAVSRAIGDHCLRPYVIPEPELLLVERCAQDEVLVVASDGLWDVVSNQEAVDMALHALQAAEAAGHTGVAATKRSANALTKAALERGTRDNVTVLIVDLRPRSHGSASSSASSSHARGASSRSRSSRSGTSRRKAAAETASSTSGPPQPGDMPTAAAAVQPPPPPAAPPARAVNGTKPDSTGGLARESAETSSLIQQQHSHAAGGAGM